MADICLTYFSLTYVRLTYIWFKDFWLDKHRPTDIANTYDPIIWPTVDYMQVSVLQYDQCL